MSNPNPPKLPGNDLPEGTPDPAGAAQPAAVSYAAAPVPPPFIPPPGGDWLGHPKGLFVLFSTELWERFSFYAMRGILTLYMTKVLLLASMGTEAAARGLAIQTYGAYLGFVYAATFAGGMLADRLLGQRRAIYIGGFLMSLAQFTLMTQALIVRSGSTAGYLYWMFFVGLALLACGNGFFKPNISTIVGTLYPPGDRRRDSAFTIFYVGINIGAALSALASAAGEKWGWWLGYGLAGSGMIASLVIFTFFKHLIAGRGLPPGGAALLGPGRLGVPNVIPLVIGVLAFIPLAAVLISRPEKVENLARWIGIAVLFYLVWEAACTAGFAGRNASTHLIALVGGVSGFLALLAQYLQTRAPEPAAGAASPALWSSLALVLLILALGSLLFLMFRAGRNPEGGRMVVVVVLCSFSMLFWGFFELAGSSIQLFVESRMDLSLRVGSWFYWQMPSTFINNVINPTLIVLMGVSFSAIWVWLDRRGLEPSSPLKFSLGLLQLGLGFLVLWVAATRAGTTGKSSFLWLFLTYFLFTTGELCLSPVGLSMVTKLAPTRLVGVFMGTWFLSSALANVITGGEVGRLTQKYDFGPVFLGIAGTAGAAALLLFILSPLLKRMMHGVK
ncbi:MAG: peptide MFS transporter [Planctomycetota bacterium]